MNLTPADEELVRKQELWSLNNLGNMDRHARKSMNPINDPIKFCDAVYGVVGLVIIGLI